MNTFFNRTIAEQNIICAAYDFEIKAIENGDASTNPLFETIKAMDGGNEIWEAINEAVEMAYC